MHENDQILDAITERMRDRLIDVDGESLPKEAAALVTIPTPSPEEMATLQSMGIVLPLVSPEALRRAFAYRQQVLSAILDESDYIYVVTYNEHGREKQAVFKKRADAIKFAEGNASEYRGAPKKSGVVKLAAALGISARRTSATGLPSEPKADFSSAVYEATYAAHREHTAEGIGMCDSTERKGQITKHEMVATADTRAYNRAVLRLAGFGDVSAEEIIAAGAFDDEESLRGGKAHVPTDPALRDPAPLPLLSEDNVLAAARTWAEAIYERGKRSGERFAPPVQQGTKTASELRAKARRGDKAAAHQLGVSGITWEGHARDSQGVRTYLVEPSPVAVEDVERTREAAAGDDDHDDHDDEPQGATDRPEPSAPATDEVISTIEAKAITDAIVKKFSFKKPITDENRQTSKKWLRENAGVETTTAIKRSQFAKLMNLLEG